MKAEYAFLFINELNIEMIKKEVSNMTRIPVDVMDSKTRKREIVTARQLSMKFAKIYTKASLATIGAIIGGKDHATVLHACTTIDNLLDTKDPQLVSVYYPLDRKFKDIQHTIERYKLNNLQLFMVVNEGLVDINNLLNDN